MENRIEIADRLKEVSTDLAGISQLLFYTYEMMRRDGVDAEHLLVLEDATDRCREELIQLAETETI